MLFAALAVLVKPAIFHLFGLYRHYWRYASAGELVSIALATLTGTAVVTLRCQLLSGAAQDNEREKSPHAPVEGQHIVTRGLPEGREVFRDEIQHGDRFAPLDLLQAQRRGEGSSRSDHIGQREGHLRRPMPFAIAAGCVPSLSGCGKMRGAN